MFWADKLLENIKGKQVINDSWTPSGIIHMGSLKGPVIHDTIFRILKEQKKDVKFLYGFDDADPIDGLPSDLYDSYKQYLGVPLYLAPSPDGKGSFGEYFGNKMHKLLKELGITPEIYKTNELYRNGSFNNAIKFVLDHADKVRTVYGEIYQKQIAQDWFPLQVICPKCGKLGTTKVTGWDGEKVQFSCEKHLVKWAEGCTTTGKISPFDGIGKMPWKVEWAAKWWTFGVTIEGAGKDHASAGGSYDVAMKLIQDVFEKKPPLKLAYEFFLSGGKKMSSSKGLGLTGEELLEILTPELTRFLMIKTEPNRAVEFTPQNTDLIPKLYDDYQKTDDEQARIFELSQIKQIKKPPQIRFSVLAQWVQMPNMQQEIKKEGAQEWEKYARVWVEKYAPESEKFLVQEQLPEQAKQLSDNQKQYLHKIASQLQKDWNTEDFQKCLYEWSKEQGISSKEAFAAIYTVLIGKNHGPKASSLILSLDKSFTIKRFKQV